MSLCPQAEPGERSSGTNPFQVLQLLPSAPQELVVEVYWHLVHQLQAAAQDDPGVRRKLDELNEAYAAAVDRSRPVRDEACADRFGEPVDKNQIAASRRATWLGGLWKRQVTRSSPRPSPWRTLQLDPEAPPDVVELAYNFWCLRLRSQSGDSAAMELAKLEEAYEALRHREADSPSEPSIPESDADAGASEVSLPEDDSSAATGAKPAPHATGAMSVAQASDASEPSRSAGLGQSLRQIAAKLGSVGRSAESVLTGGWQQRPDLFEKNTIERGHDFPGHAPEPDADDAAAPWRLAEQPLQSSAGEHAAMLTGSPGEDGGSAASADVVVAAHDIPANTELTEDVLEVRALPMDRRVAGAFATIRPLVGLQTRYPVAKGEQMTPLEVRVSAGQDEGDVARVLPPGKRGFAVEVTKVSGVGGLLLPGNTVDVIAVLDEASAGIDKAVTMLQNIEVLAVAQEAPAPVPSVASRAGGSAEGQDIRGQRSDEVEGQPGAFTVTLTVTPDQAQLLALVQEHGKVWLSLRPLRKTRNVSLREANLLRFHSPPLSDR